MLVKTYGYAVHGIHASLVTTEVNVSNGINFYMVGLPDSAVKESQHRIHSALNQTGYKMPGKQVTVNMAPADIRKEGSAYDLTIAAGVLAASEQLHGDLLNEYVIMGELSLDGTLRPVKGILPIAVSARQDGFRGIILPAENAAEAAVVNGLEVRYATHLKEVTDFLNGVKDLPIKSEHSGGV
jgi:magnesium chelatase family protein